MGPGSLPGLLPGKVRDVLWAGGGDIAGLSKTVGIERVGTSYWPSPIRRKVHPYFAPLTFPLNRGQSPPIQRLNCYDHSMIFATTPAPTVRPPSRIAKRKPSSIAIGWISVTSIEMLSPGITISVPFGSSIEPVTSVVRK